jgi:hypothetical protein
VSMLTMMAMWMGMIQWRAADKGRGRLAAAHAKSFAKSQCAAVFGTICGFCADWGA